tara:strand:+ start:153 stop:509 length:357 start_codon:yes stop_codon:yes gene_type:complete
MSVFSTLDTLLDQRHSCRGFLDQPVERTLVERIVTTAQKVPSWCNSQPWQLIVLSTGETNRLRETLYDAASGSAPLSPDVGFPEHYQASIKSGGPIAAGSFMMRWAWPREIAPPQTGK